MAWLLEDAKQNLYITPFLQRLHWLLVTYRLQFKVLAFKGTGSTYMHAGLPPLLCPPVTAVLVCAKPPEGAALQTGKFSNCPPMLMVCACSCIVGQPAEGSKGGPQAARPLQTVQRGLEEASLQEEHSWHSGRLAQACCLPCSFPQFDNPSPAVLFCFTGNLCC